MMEKISLLQVAYNEKDLEQKIHAFFRNELPVMQKISAFASAELINSISDFIEPQKPFVVSPQTL